MVNVILTGMRGTGKSSIGRALASQLNYRFLDTDSVVETLASARISDIVATHGWAYFRSLERQAVVQYAATVRQVIAAGGGTLIDAQNVASLKAHGVVVLLVCDIPVLQLRIDPEGTRPSLTGQGSAVEELAKVWQDRRETYQAVADLTYDVSEQSTDLQQDVQRKAIAIRECLRKFPAFQQEVTS